MLEKKDSLVQLAGKQEGNTMYVQALKSYSLALELSPDDEEVRGKVAEMKQKTGETGRDSDDKAEEEENSGHATSESDEEGAGN